MEATDHPAENLVGRSLSPVAIAAYGSRDLVERDQQAGIVPGGDDNVWVEYLTDSEMSRACRRLRATHAAARVFMFDLIVCYCTLRLFVRALGTPSCPAFWPRVIPTCCGLETSRRYLGRPCGC